MKAKIHYAFKSNLIKKKKEDGEFEFLEVNKDFYNDNPILAREEAFNYYQNYIDVLLESKGLKYESDKQAKEALESFHNPKTSRIWEHEGIRSTIHDGWGNGIGVFLIIDEPVDDNQVDDIDLIHGFGNLWVGGSSSEESLMFGLETEYEIYKDNNYAKGNYETSVVFCNSDEWLEGYTEEEPQTYTILKTPFDWTGMDKPYWWGDPEKEEEKQLESTSKTRSVEDIIANGETNTVEFKPALLYNFKSQSGGIGVKGIIAKSICAFLNSNGGYLFMGVKDDGSIQGLEYDFSLAGDKNPRDFFRLEFDDTIKQFLPISIKSNIKGEFITIDNKEIFLVIVYPSKSKPIFMNGQHGKEFWVRWTASTRQYIDIEEIATYCLEHWKNND